MLEVLGDDYVRTARAKGVAESSVIARHAFRNAMVPVATLLVLQFGRLLGGAVITESVFSLPGIGKLIVNGAANRDYTLVLGLVVLVTVVAVLLNLLVDLAYAWLDPKIRY